MAENGKYRNILAEILDALKRTRSEDAVRKIFEELKPYGVEAMNREVIAQILHRHFTSSECEEFFVRYPEILAAYEHRLK